MPASSDPVPSNLNKYSRHITQPKSQGASQAMLYATGLTEEDMNKPQASRDLSITASITEQRFLAYMFVAL